MADGDIFARKTGNINSSMFAAPKLALVPARGSDRYNVDVTRSYHNACAKFPIKVERGSDGDP